jgi:transcriptional regulator with XRE-family HTH domain
MVDTLDHHVAHRVRELRDRRGLSQAELARRLTELGLRFDRITVAKIERGNRNVKVGEAVQLAAALGVSPSALLFGGDDELEIAPNLTLPAVFVRAWVRGDVALQPKDAAFYAEAREGDERLPMAALAEMFVSGEIKCTAAGKDLLRAYVAQMKQARELVLTLPGGEDARRDLLKTFDRIDQLEEALS